LPKATGVPFGFLRAHAFAHQLLGALFNVQAHFFGEIVVELAATEDIRHPVHGKLLSPARCLHTYARAGDMPFKLAQTRSGG
jgi:hypothetical protein